MTDPEDDEDYGEAVVGPDCEHPFHVFACDIDGSAARETECQCGEYTWGWMEDQLVLTQMWEASR